MHWLTRRRFLAAAAGAVAVAAGGAVALDRSSTESTTPMDKSFTSQSSIADGFGGVQLTVGAEPAAGRIWEVKRVFWNVNAVGNVADRVQTYLYRLPATYSREQALKHMGSSLEGWLGCCGNSGLTGNGDMGLAPNDVLIRPGQYLWMYFITPTSNNGYVMAAGCSVWEQPQ